LIYSDGATVLRGTPRAYVLGVWSCQDRDVTVVLVHGNPETDAVWGPLVDALGRVDVVRLSPPGFGAPLPSGFPATYLAYRDWLVDELERMDQPVDLVGHDWGGGHVMNAVMHRPELVRSWASDVIGLFDPEYVWHDMAQGFQTPETGEQLVAMMQDGSVEDRAQQLAGFGVPHDVAMSFAAAQGPEMSQAILAVYRSARQPALAEAGRALENAAARPGLSLLATEDPFVGTEEMRRRAADRAGARTAVLEGLGHWWMVENPAVGAAVLTEFWESLGG
jgi:pimeloyl-ACP methyl ester carboxylesterase